jgi:hypothetical protein
LLRLTRRGRLPRGGVSAPWGVGLDRVGRKGGRARGEGLPERVDELAESLVREVEPLGGLLLREAVDEDGAKGLVLALTRGSGVEEGVAQRGVVHGRSSRKCEEISQACRGKAMAKYKDPPAGNRQERRPEGEGTSAEAEEGRLRREAAEEEGEGCCRPTRSPLSP